ncbi:MAG: ABC transporter ATP-binding protein [Desulfocucumaceae bacterium]
MENKILEICGLKKHFGGIRAVDGVDIGVYNGEIRAVIGPNGAGKTTLFNLISGRLAPTEGEIVFAGKRLQGLDADKIVKLGVGRAFQVANIFRGLTVFENVQMAVMTREGKAMIIYLPLSRLSAVREETWELLKLVGLENRADEVAGVLSHGDQKRLDLAIALAARPRLLLLDEPTAGMAMAERYDIVNLVEKIIHEKGLSLVFTEHDMDVVFSISDYISVMHQGKTIAHGRPDEVREIPEVKQAYLGEL